MKRSYQIFRWGCFGKYVIKLPSFTEKHHLNIKSPHFFLQSDKHTLSKLTYHHEKTQALSQRHLAVAKPCVPLKQRKQKSSVSCFVLMSVWLMNPLANDLKQQSSQGTDVFTDRQSARSQHHRKLTNHCSTHQQRWFSNKGSALS